MLFRSKEIQDKISNTIKSDNVQNKIRHTNMNRYGVPYAMQNRDLFIKQSISAKHTLSDDGNRIDSGYEKLIYEFCKINNLHFKQQIPIIYESDGKEHVTYVDFLIEGIFFEAKGSHLFKDLLQDSSYMHRKIDVYSRYNVVIVTDSVAANLFDTLSLIGLDINTFKDISFECWNSILTCIANLQGFISKDTIVQYKSMQLPLVMSKISKEVLDELYICHRQYTEALKIRNKLSRDSAGPRVWIHNKFTNQRTTVLESMIDLYLNNGWVRGCNYTTVPGYVWIHNGNSEKRVDSDELFDYLNLGWVEGRLESNTTKGYVLIYKEGIQTSVPLDKLQSYLSDGWTKGEIPGKHFSGFCILTNKQTGKVKHVKLEEKQAYLDSGNYIEKNAIVGKVHIHKNGKAKMVKENELDYYLADGWRKGRLKSYTANRIWICNDDTQSNLRICESELSKYLADGWRKGRIMKKRQS